MFSPKLTTVKQDTDQIGKEAADRLISIIAVSYTHLKYVTKLCDNFWQLFKSTVKSADYSAFFVILYIPNIESIS